MTVTALRTPEVDIDKIDVVDGFNARQHFDKTELNELAETIKLEGVVQPVDVRPTDNGRFDLVAGERRLRAAKLAGLKKMPINIGKGNARAAAFIENHHRANLNPIETALDLKAYAEEFGLTTNKEIAERAKKKPAWVGQHLALLKLPKEVQRYIAAGEVPMSAEPKLRKIAEVSPGVAVAVCEVAKQNSISGIAFNERFAELFAAAGEVEVKGKPTMIPAYRFTLSEVVGKGKKFAKFAERLNAERSTYLQRDDPFVELGDPEIDAARAAGCLVEYQYERRGGYSTTSGYIIDKKLAEDLIDRAIERKQKETEARAKADKEAKAKEKENRKQQREARKASGGESVQAEAKKRKAKARLQNQEFKRNVLKKRTPARRKKFALSRAQAVAIQLISDNPKLAGRGLRLISDQLQEVEVKPLKSGGNREKITYADAKQSTAELMRRVMATKDPLEVIEVLAEALLVALVADGDELPGAAQIGWGTRVADQLKKTMATEIKEVRPRQTRRSA